MYKENALDVHRNADQALTVKYKTIPETVAFSGQVTTDQGTLQFHRK